MVVGVLSLAPCYVRKRQVCDKGVPLSYHHGKAVSSLVDDCQTMHPPPANVKRLESKKFYICSDVTHTHTPHVAGFDYFGRTSRLRSAEPIKSNRLHGASVHSRGHSLRREIRFELKYLDRVTEAHAFNHPPRVVDFPRCHSSRQSG